MKKLLCVVSALIVGIDLWSKHWIESTLALGESVTMIPGFFDLTYVRNTGAAWSLFSGKQGLFLIVTPIVLIGLIYYFFKQEDAWNLTGIALIFAGAVGNYVDRLAFGYVRDMFAFNIFGYDFPVFNIADSAVVIGVAFLIIAILREEMRLKNG